MTEQSIELVEKFGAAWARHDLDDALSFMTDDCIFDSTGPAPDGKRSVGHDEVRAAWQPIFADESSTFEAEETFAADNRVIQLWRYSWSGGHIRGIDVIKLRDGKIAEKISYVKG